MSGLTKAGKEREIIIRMRRIQWGNPTIKSAGYDAQQQMLEIEFASDGQIWQFDNVPEDIWYRFRSYLLPEFFFHNFIMGRYPERQMQENAQKIAAYEGNTKKGNNIMSESRSGQGNPLRLLKFCINLFPKKVEYAILLQKSCLMEAEIFEIGRETLTDSWQKNCNRHCRKPGEKECSG